jgi:nucleoside-diphosphate-sugar epimerase
MTATAPVPAPRGGRREAAVLITGANGEVGHGLIRQLHAAGKSAVVGIDVRKISGELVELCHESFVGDICDISLLERLLAMYEITEIYHLASLLSTRAEFTPETAHDVNVVGTLNLLRLAAEQARSHGQRVRFLFPSSIAVYGLPDLETKRQHGPVREGEHLRPHTMYGCNKLSCEMLGRYYGRHYRKLAQDRICDILDFRSLRLPGLISSETLPSGGTSDYAPEMIHAAAKGEPYSCFVRADSRIPFMTMPDAIQAMLQLAQAEESQLERNVYNVAAFSASAEEMVDRVRRHFPDAQITFAPDEARQSIIDSWPEDVDCSAAQHDWHFEPQHDLNTSFEAYLVPRIAARYSGD